MLTTDEGFVKIMEEYGNKIIQNGLKPLFTMKFSEESKNFGTYSSDPSFSNCHQEKVHTLYKQ
jgi:hypothetical protein